MIEYPKGLPAGLQSGSSYQTVSPMQRSTLVTGRAIQRRRYTNVPTSRKISWIFNSQQAQVFEVWFKYSLNDGVSWFECPLKTPLGLGNYKARFVDIYDGPSIAGHSLWSFSAELELLERPVLDGQRSEFPEYILDQSIIDIAVNDHWPLNPWQKYILETDESLNKEWPNS